MIYAVVLTQLLFLSGVAGLLYFGAKYLERQDERTRSLQDAMMKSVIEQQAANLELIRHLQEEAAAQVLRVIDKSHRDFEMLAERIQFPEQMQAQAAAAPDPDIEASEPIVMDDARMWELEHPDQDREQLTPVQPIQAREPVTPFGKA